MLRRVSDDAVRAIAAKLAHPIHSMRLDAVRTVRRFGPGGKRLVPQLIARLHADPPLRREIVRTLQILDVPPDDGIHALAAHLTDDDTASLASAIDAVSRYYGAARSLIPRIGRHVHHASSTVRAAAIAALGRIGGTEAEVFRAALEDDESRVRIASIRAVRQQLLHYRVRKALRERLGDAESNVRLEAAAAMVEAGMRNDRVADVIGRAVLETTVTNRAPPLDALQRSGTSARAAAPHLAKAIRPGARDLGQLVRTFCAVASEQAQRAVHERARAAEDRVFRSTVSQMVAIRPRPSRRDRLQTLRAEERDVLRSLATADTNAKRAALNAIAQRQVKGEWLLPRILTALDDTDRIVRALGIAVLAARKIVTQEARAKVEASLADATPIVRLVATYYFGHVRRSATSGLDDALRDEDARVRTMAAWALGQTPHAASVPKLALRLVDEPGVARVAAYALLRHAEVAGPAVRDAFRGVPSPVKRLPPSALAAYHPRAAFAHWKEQLADPAPNVRRRAMIDLLRLHHDPNAVVDALLPLVDDQSRFVAEGALAALASYRPPRKRGAPVIHPACARALPAALRILKKQPRYRNHRLATPALTLIRTLGPLAAAAVDDAAWIEPSVDVYSAIGAMGPAAAAAVPTLIEGLNHPRHYPIANAAANALGKIGAGARAAIPHLLASAAMPEVAPACWRALARIHPRPASLLPLVIDTMNERTVDRPHSLYRRPRRRVAGETPWSLYDVHAAGTLAPESPAVLRCLVRARLWPSLRRFGPRAEPAVPFLIAALGDRRQHGTVEALTAIGRGARSALPALRRLATHPDTTDFQRRRYREAIRAIEQASK